MANNFWPLAAPTPNSVNASNQLSYVRMSSLYKNNENNLNTTTSYRVIPSKKNSLIVEETDSTLAPLLTNVDCPVEQTLPIDSNNTKTTSNMFQQNQSGATPAYFNFYSFLHSWPSSNCL